MIFLDANILLEGLLPGRKNLALVLPYLTDPQSIVSPLNAHLYVHFGKKSLFDVEKLAEDLKQFTYTNMDTDTVLWAIQNRQNTDFEDALQVASAVMSGCKTFVTFDKQLAKAYKKHITMVLLG